MKKGKRQYDFSGYVTKNNILCSDGVIIDQNAFKHSDGKKVPLVWNHNYSSPSNVLGYMELKHDSIGTYGYGYFNSTDDAASAKEMVRHGDISSVSIGARNIKKAGNKVIKGDIYEISLVLSGANPGATIDTIVEHSGTGNSEKGIITTGLLIHSSEDEDIDDEDIDDEDIDDEDIDDEDIDDEDIDDEDIDDEDIDDEELADVLIETFEDLSDDELDEFFEELDDDEAIEIANILGIEIEESEEDLVRQSIFNGRNEVEKGVSREDQQILLQSAIENKVESFNQLLHEAYDESTQVGGTNFGITNIEYLFPEGQYTDQTPRLVMDQNTDYKTIINGVSKVPFSKIKTRYFDIDIQDEKQRARGYTKGTRKVEEVIKVLRRETHPTTIYKKQKLDRDDIIEITDFDVVAALNMEMRMLFEIELARAILVGDGREEHAEGKIPEDKIRPIAFDDEVYTIKGKYKDAAGFHEAIIKAMPEYQGSGSPILFIDPKLLADIKLLKGTDGRWLNGHIPSNVELAAEFGVKEVRPTSFLGKSEKTKGLAIIVNLADYDVGSTKGGQLTTFNDFDIDFNRYKYLIESRLSGALKYPKSAIVLSKDNTPG